MFAVIKTGGKQYRVAADDQITVMSLRGAAGEVISFGEVLSLGGADATELGTPFVEGARVVGEIVAQARGPKVIAFKKRRRQNSRRKRGHRQDLTVVRITEILSAGQSPSERATVVESASADVPAHAPDGTMAEAGAA